jgi:hypothetical protein
LWLALAAMASAQVAQNPSPMSDTTRPHPRMAQTRPPGARAALGLGELYLSERFGRRARAPLVVHFHGASWLLEHHVRNAAPGAVLVTVNAGAGSGRYAAAFADPALFPALLDEAAKATETLTRQRPAWTTVTLTAFSAGYGAVRALLAQPDAAPRITRIVLADGLHASYRLDGDPSAPRASDPVIDTAGLEVFTRFAAEAAAGRRQFWLTHSEVYPGAFASTTETANVLLASLELTRRPTLKRGPIGMQQLSEAHRGGFHVAGFAGNSAPDHADHLYALGE